MKQALDFIGSALPWIGIGLTLALVAAMSPEGGDALNGAKQLLYSAPALCFFAPALIQMKGDSPSGAVWIVLGVCSLFLLRLCA